jgi:hypothetical protein
MKSTEDLIDMTQTKHTNSDNLVSIRGKLFNETTIELPDEWEDIADPKTITVSITPCGMPHEIFVKTVDIKEVRLDTHKRTPIECFYHIFAERKIQS